MTGFKENFTINDLLDDNQFIQLIKNRSLMKDAREEWQNLLNNNNEDKRELLMQAACIIDLMNEEKQAADPNRRAALWNNINQQLGKEKKLFAHSWMKAVSILVLLIGVAGLIKWHLKTHKEQITWKTGVTESRKIQLPDNSVIIIGNNSSLAYEKNWDKNLPREVWLTGEARFEVVHINKDANHISKEEKFIVHVNNELDVEVLGTVFNVIKKAGKLSVVLESGAIMLNRPGKKGILLKPGEQAELDESKNVLTKRKTIEQHLQGNLAQNSVELDNTSMAEIIKLMEKTYHKKIESTDPSILTRRIDGSFPLFNEKDAWFTLSNILDIDIEIRNDSLLILKPKKN